MHLCKYCYANGDEKTILNNYKKHDPNSPFLIGNKNSNDIIKEAKQESYIDNRLTIFDL